MYILCIFVKSNMTVSPYDRCDKEKLAAELA